MNIKSNPINNINLEGKVLVMREEVLLEEYRHEVGNRLWRASTGFGCDPTAIGKAVFAVCLGDGEKARWSRYDFEGWITNEEAQSLMLPGRIF